MRALSYGGGGAYPGEINERIAHDLFAPDRGIGEDLAAYDLDGHGDNEHHVEYEKRPTFEILVQQFEHWFIPRTRAVRRRPLVLSMNVAVRPLSSGANCRKAPGAIGYARLLVSVYASWT